jgi:hypothetical protein
VVSIAQARSYILVKRVARLVVRGLNQEQIGKALKRTRKQVNEVLAHPDCEAEIERLLEATGARIEDQLVEGEREAAQTLRDALEATESDGSPNWEVRIKAAVRFLDAAGRRGKPADRVEQRTLTLTGDAAQAAVAAALRDPGVRQWLDAQPDLKQQLLPSGNGTSDAG